MLTKIRASLEALNYGKVMYGRVTDVPQYWNYIVFGRDTMRKSGTSRNDFNRYYTVAIVHEDCLPKDAEITVIQELEKIPGLKLANDDIRYDYMVKSDNKKVVEMAVITFTEIIKGYKV